MAELCACTGDGETTGSMAVGTPSANAKVQMHRQTPDVRLPS
jgi:hypothetical protein